MVAIEDEEHLRKEAKEHLNHNCQCNLTSRARTTHNDIIQTFHDNLNMFITLEQASLLQSPIWIPHYILYLTTI